MPQAIWKLLVYANRIYGRTIGRVIGGKQYRLPEHMSVEQFLRELHRQDIKYVVLRWFEGLPDIEPGGDLDLLVADTDYEKILSLLSFSRRGIGCDVYSQSDKGGGLYKKLTAYFCPALASAVLNGRIYHKDYISVPAKDDHFHSLAYHAIYQKGLKSGLPTSTAGLKPLRMPAHDYQTILKQLAEEAGIELDISMEELDDHLHGEGFRPPAEILAKLARHNIWIRERHCKDDV